MAVAPTALSAPVVRDSSVTLSPQRLLYALWALFWLLMIVVAVQDNAHIGWWKPLLWEGSSCAVATLWLWIQRLGMRRFAHDLDRPLRWVGRHLLWMLLVIVTFAAS